MMLSDIDVYPDGSLMWKDEMLTVTWVEVSALSSVLKYLVIGLYQTWYM